MVYRKQNLTVTVNVNKQHGLEFECWFGFFYYAGNGDLGYWYYTDRTNTDSPMDKSPLPAKYAVCNSPQTFTTQTDNVLSWQTGLGNF